MNHVDNPKVLVLCADDSDAARPSLAVVEKRADIVYTRADSLASHLDEADVLFLWDFFSPAVRSAWTAPERLRWLHVASAGVDSLLFPELVDSDVIVTNSRGVFDRPMAEYVLSCVLAFAKDLPTTLELQSRKSWRHRETETIAGQRVVVVGTGSIGRAVAQLLRAAGMDVVGVGRTARERDADFAIVYSSGQLRAAVADADYVVVAAPLTDSTRGMFDSAMLTAMKPTSRLINVGRGPIVDERALAEALQDGRLAGAALDVFEVEPLPETSPLWQEVPNVIVSPHMSGDVVGWTDALAALFETNFVRWHDGQPLLNVVDKRLGFVPAGAGEH
jgi:phosphoglycerate dehydrogenase-like enzyme